MEYNEIKYCNHWLEHKLHIFEIIILNTKWKDRKSHKTVYEKFYLHEKKLRKRIATVNLSKIYFLKNAKKTCKSNNRDLNRDWKKRFTFK